MTVQIPDTLSPGKQRLIDALCALLDERSMESISVGDICSKAGVSRQTFYRHFQTKQEIAITFLSREANKSFFRLGRDLNWHDSFVSVINLYGEYDNYGLKMLTPEMMKEAFRVRVETLESTITDYRGLELTEELHFQVVFFARAEAEFLDKYFIRRDAFSLSRLPVDRLADLLESCVPEPLHSIIQLPE